MSDAMAALLSITQGSKIRAYGILYTTERGERRESIALTDEQRRLVARAVADPETST